MGKPVEQRGTYAFVGNPSPCSVRAAVNPAVPRVNWGGDFDSCVFGTLGGGIDVSIAWEEI